MEVPGKEITILAFGNSLTAGYGLPEEASYPSLIEKRLKGEGYKVRIINAGVSGDTTEGALARLPWTLGQNPDVAILEIGANDALRGFGPEVTRNNIDSMLTLFEEKNIPVLFAGMKAPPNMGDTYAEEFDSIFPELAEKHDVLFYPFFLEKVAGNLDLNQSDGIHPNAQGMALIAEDLYPFVLELISQIKQKQ